MAELSLVVVIVVSSKSVRQMSLRYFFLWSLCIVEGAIYGAFSEAAAKHFNSIAKILYCTIKGNLGETIQGQKTCGLIIECI